MPAGAPGAVPTRTNGSAPPNHDANVGGAPSDARHVEQDPLVNQTHIEKDPLVNQNHIQQDPLVNQNNTERDTLVPDPNPKPRPTTSPDKTDNPK